jgi:hypothetical protein
LLSSSESGEPGFVKAGLVIERIGVMADAAGRFLAVGDAEEILYSSAI